MTRWFVFNNSKLLLQILPDGSYTIPQAVQPPLPVTKDNEPLLVTRLPDGSNVMTYTVSKLPAPIPSSLPSLFYDLRQSYFVLPEDTYVMAGKCHELVYWNQRTRYCGHCASPLELNKGPYKECPSCGQLFWPTLSTAVIVLISRDDEVLLVRSRDFRGNHYGLVAGFVETGESLEAAICREVKEETNLEIQDLTYFGSQPWPYPCGLMVGFMAKYKGGELQLQESELATGGWFHYTKLPEIPQKMSIARKLIDNWVNRKSHERD